MSPAQQLDTLNRGQGTPGFLIEKTRLKGRVWILSRAGLLRTPMVFVPLRRAGLSCICAGVRVHRQGRQDQLIF